MGELNQRVYDTRSFVLVNQKIFYMILDVAKILKSRDVAKTFVKVEVRFGKSTSFWYDNWSSLGSLTDITGLRGFIDLGIPSHSTVEHVIDSHKHRYHRVEVLNRIDEEIDKLKGSNRRSLWRRKGDTYKQRFITSHTWNLIRHCKPLLPWHRGIWFPNHMPKFIFTAWLAMHNRSSTGERMAIWDSSYSPVCILCRNPLESRNHLFFECTYSKNVWSALAHGLLGGKFTSNWNSLVTIITDFNQGYLQTFTIRHLFQTFTLKST